MILVRLFLLVIAVSFGLVLMLGAGLLLTIRHNFKGLFTSAPKPPSQPYENVIEGEYKVINEGENDRHN